MSDRTSRDDVLIISARPMNDARLQQIARYYAKLHDLASFDIQHKTDEALLGGFVVIVAGLRYDFSTRGQIDTMGNRLRETDPGAACRDDMDGINDFECVLRETLSSALEEPKGDIVDEIGSVIKLSDNVATVDGLWGCMSGELIVFSSGTYGIALNLLKEHVGVMVLGGTEGLRAGMTCARTRRRVSVPVGTALLGRVVDALGRPIDGKGPIRTTKRDVIEKDSPNVTGRSPVNEPLFTGITAIDAMTPIGKGQRELIVGDRQTGKTTIAIDTIIHQRDKDVICVYVAIGKKMADIVRTARIFEEHDALAHTIIVAASADQGASMQYIAPYTGCTMAEYFMCQKKKNALIVYDDLTRHAQAYRTISLLLRRPPGREAFPGDVFYLHARLLERAGKLCKEMGGGSLTAIPILETQGQDISAYIPTNVISITDGQIYLEPELFFSGQRPAINVGLSVSRVGGDAQTRAMRTVAGPLRLRLAQAREMASFAQFGSDIDENTRAQIREGEILNFVFRQRPFAGLSTEEQVAILYLANSRAMTFLYPDDIGEFIEGYMNYMRERREKLLTTIRKTGQLDDATKQALDETITSFKLNFIALHTAYANEDV